MYTVKGVCLVESDWVFSQLEDWAKMDQHIYKLHILCQGHEILK